MSGAPAGRAPGGDPEREEERRALVREIEAEARATASWTGRAAFDPRVLAALATVPRHRFMPERDADQAYLNAARPIGCGQTISQPYVVALMTDLARVGPDDVVLEIGTGSGYQTAVLATLAKRVYSVEAIESLGVSARERLARLGYANVEVRIGDGWEGWPEHAPYAAIVVTAAAPEIPQPLVEQLAPGGRLVIPLGAAWSEQELVAGEKDATGALRTRSVLPVAFVPLVHGRTAADQARD
jgi:protein-L-isoaspartate(D-aspartate) O-methyltransferase